MSFNFQNCFFSSSVNDTKNNASSSFSHVLTTSFVVAATGGATALRFHVAMVMCTGCADACFSKRP